MRKLLAVLFLTLGLPLAASAQFVPKATIFAGYTLVRSRQSSGIGFNQNGWDVSAELRPASWFGMVADVSQQYASPFGEKERQTSFLFGPQLSLPGIKHVVPFAHVLIGGVHGTSRVPNGILCPITGCSGTPVILGTAFATAVGGGVDFKLVGPLWVRPIQIDYLHANLDPDHHTQMRIAAGLALRL